MPRKTLTIEDIRKKYPKSMNEYQNVKYNKELKRLQAEEFAKRQKKQSDYDRKGAVLFTFSPDPKKVLQNLPDKIVDPRQEYRMLINKYFNSWKKCMLEFEVNPEFSLSGRIHFHGYYVVKDEYAWRRRIQPTMAYNGFIDVKPAQVLSKAIEYSRKDRDKMIVMLHPEPVPFGMDSELFKKVVIEEKAQLIKQAEDDINKFAKYGFLVECNELDYYTEADKVLEDAIREITVDYLDYKNTSRRFKKIFKAHEKVHKYIKEHPRRVEIENDVSEYESTKSLF